MLYQGNRGNSGFGWESNRDKGKIREPHTLLEKTNDGNVYRRNAAFICTIFPSQ